MTDKIKNEAIEQLELDIRCGFENESELFESISEMFIEEDDFDENWFKKIISEKFTEHLAQSRTWNHPTDFERLAKTFDALIKEKIVCHHNAGFTKSDAEDDCMDTIEQLAELGINANGFCYYHSQDLGHAIDPKLKNLYLGFDSPNQNDAEALVVANTIVEKLKQNGFEVNWPGTVNKRIEILNIDWKKIPDDQDWGGERVINILSNLKHDKKPFWKFW